MNNGIKTGVFLCECGEIIKGKVDLPALQGMLKGAEGVATIESSSHFCTGPGLARIAKTIESQGLNRILLGACSDRIMKKKFTEALKDFGLLDSQIEMVNLKDHIALVNEEPKEELTRKAAALLTGAAASLGMLEPCAPALAEFKGPTLILGGGVSGFETARELARRKVESILFLDLQSPDEVLARLPRSYPGAQPYREQLKKLLDEVFAEPLVTVAQDGPIEYLTGHVGDYRLGLRSPDGALREFHGSVLAFALDSEFVSGERIFTGGGNRVIDQLELEERVANGGVGPGRILFWANGGGETSAVELEALSAWRTCRYLAEKHPGVSSAVLYPSSVSLRLTAVELREARNRGIGLHSYDPAIHPVVDLGYLTWMGSRDHLNHEIQWDTLVISAVPGPPSVKALELSRYARVFPFRDGLKKSPLEVKPEQEPVGEPFLAGSARQACDLNEALQQGKRVARQILRLKEKAGQGGLASSLVVVAVDENLCEGCGLCSEICTCCGVENVKPAPGAALRSVDPHTCEGGGSCAAACPYGAMKLLNNTTQQLEARVKAVVAGMKENDVLGFACSWSGQGAAELAALKNLTYSGRLFMIPVRCLGTIDPSILSMAFLSGANFIMLAGCTPTASCHYGYGVDHTWSRVNLVKNLLALSGLERQRIALGYVDVNQPDVFVRMVESFVGEADGLGPIERTPERQNRLRAVHATMLRPRVRWVLGASLRRPSEPEFPGEQVNPMEFDEVMQDVIKEEYLCARIMDALRPAPLSSPQIAGILGENVTEITRHLNELLKDQRVVAKRREGYPYFSIAK